MIDGNKREIKMTSQFKKDYRAAKRQGKNIKLLLDVIAQLANDEPLADKHRDHQLKGKLKAYRECHVSPDWLLVYEKYGEDCLILDLIRINSHSNIDF